LRWPKAGGVLDKNLLVAKDLLAGEDSSVKAAMKAAKATAETIARAERGENLIKKPPMGPWSHLA